MSKKRKNKKITPEKKRFFDRMIAKIGLSIMAGLVLFSNTKTPRLERIVKKEQRITQTIREEQSLDQIYQTWMMHYNPEGFSLGYLEKQFKNMKELPKQTSLKISFPKKYSEYPINLLKGFFYVYTSEQNIRNLAKRLLLNREIKGVDEVAEYFKKNYDTLSKKSVDDLSRWVLNAAYYCTRKTLRSAPTDVKSHSMEELNKAFENGYGDCEVLTVLTEQVYLAIAKNFKGKIKELGKRITSYFGIFVSESVDDGHRWLTITYKGQKKIVELNNRKDNYLFGLGRDYNPDVDYIFGKKIREGKYVPLFSESFEQEGENSFTIYRKVHILPSEIEKEILEH